ncbi:MAG: radical SAM/Cys-rich domain protein [Phycisphaera sp.]|nr:radical SAM/Cys-rich domain protein [Phycisphaera sp.]
MTTSAAHITIRGDNAFDRAVRDATDDALHAASRIATLQINVGLTCNLACHHCHVESSPARTEQMDWPTMQAVMDVARRVGADTIDITGGAPEMNPHFRRFVEAARADGRRVMVRTNLTILLEPDYADLPGFFAASRVHLVASLPCYLEANVDKQRGKRVYTGSIDAIRRLNAVGYGGDNALPLDLVYNPGGPSLPPDQASLESDYRRELDERFGIRFTRLICITNMAIGRFLHDLERDGKADAYQRLLRDSFNADAVTPLMCRHQLHVSYDGTLHDCDFNYALGMPCHAALPQNVRDFDAAAFAKRRIATGEHCFGCTAGNGSSCGGALVAG